MKSMIMKGWVKIGTRDAPHQQGMGVTKYSLGDPEMQTIQDFSFNYFLQIPKTQNSSWLAESMRPNIPSWAHTLVDTL